MFRPASTDRHLHGSTRRRTHLDEFTRPLVAVRGQQADEHRAGQASGGQRDDLRGLRSGPARHGPADPAERDDQRDRRRGDHRRRLANHPADVAERDKQV